MGNKIMKQLSKYISESNQEMKGSSFSEKVKYSKKDWELWKKLTKEDVFVGNYDNEPELELVYIPDHTSKTVKHIATYNTKTETLFCDDLKLFGNET